VVETLSLAISSAREREVTMSYVMGRFVTTPIVA
jgi:hypothetical protein